MALNIKINLVAPIATIPANTKVADIVVTGGTAPYNYTLVTGSDSFSIDGTTVKTKAEMTVANIASFSVLATDSASPADTVTSDVTYPAIESALALKMTKANIIYKITRYYDLGHGTLTIPAGCTLDFQGGSFANGTIIGKNTSIKGSKDRIFLSTLQIDGTWKTELKPQFFGAKGDGQTNDTTAFKSLFIAANSVKCNIFIPKGHYIINSLLQVTNDIDITGEGAQSILDFSSKDTSIKSDIIVKREDSYSTLPTTTDLTAGDSTVTFTSNPHLQIGDIFTIVDKRANSYSKYRAYYRQGEICEVVSVAGNTVTLSAPLYAGYNGNDVIATKLNTLKVRISNINIKSRVTTNVGAQALALYCTRDSVVDNVTASGTNYVHINLINAYNCLVNSCIINYNSPAVSYNYGIAINNSQNIIISDCIVRAARHGVTIGGQDYDTNVINRNILVTGCNIQGYTALPGADSHGNAEFVTFSNCILNSGISIGGNHQKIEGCTLQSQLGNVTIDLVDLAGHDFNIINNTITVEKYILTNDSGRGVIQLQSGNSGTDNYGGIMTIANNTITVGNQAAIDKSVQPISLYFTESSQIEGLIINNNTIKNGNVDSRKTNLAIQIIGKFKLLEITNNVLNSCILISSPNGISEVKRLNISGNKIYDSPRGGIMILGGTSNNEYITIENNIIINSKQTGIYISPPTNQQGGVTIVTGNSVINSGLDGSGSSEQRSSLTISRVKLLVITDNIYGDMQETTTQATILNLSNIPLVRMMGNTILSTSIGNTITNVTDILDSGYLIGPTASRPVSQATRTKGRQYFDTTLNKYICWDGTAWINVDGTALA